MACCMKINQIQKDDNDTPPADHWKNASDGVSWSPKSNTMITGCVLTIMFTEVPTKLARI